MDKFSRNIRIVSAIIVLLFVSLIAYLSRFMVEDAKEVQMNSFNQRNYIQEEKVRRGDILDRNGQILATTVKVNGKNVRKYPFGRLFAHVVGYNSRRYGKTGIELAFNKQLLGLDNDMVDNITTRLLSKKPKGKNVQLTVDANLQQTAHEALAGRKGAVVAMDPKTGEVLSMVSLPDFDPNNVESDWKALRDNLDSPFYNRATQGLYAPGSTFKIITSCSALKYDPKIDEYSYNCTGVRDIKGYKLRCYKGESHGRVDLKRAFQMSCNTAFAGIGIDVGRENLLSVAEGFGFNKKVPFELPVSKSQLLMDEGSSVDLAQASIGQGKTTATPLMMAMVASCIANDGNMMEPYIEKSLYTDKAFYKSNKSSEAFATPISQKISDKLKEMMKLVVDSGTGAAARISGISVGGKTGTAEADDETHAWFVCFAPVENPRIAVSVVLENAKGDGGTLAAPVARMVLKKALELGY